MSALKMMTRLGLFASVAGLSSVASAQVLSGDLTIELEPIATGLPSPILVTHAGDGSGRLFIVDQGGKILIWQNGAVLPQPFLDLTSEIPSLAVNFDERGVLGLAFHPNFAQNGRFFVRYSKPRPGQPGEPCFNTTRGCHEEILAGFTVSANPNVANAGGTILFRVDEPEFNHNAGDVAFGPDGMLYFSLGDGGGAHDGLAANPPAHGPIGHGQNLETWLGSMLRIDVDSGFPYAIPADNPFVSAPGLDEIWAYGFRNPYRFTFDDGPGGNGALYVADVGQNLFEELDIVVRGGNYGWVIREGFHCFDPLNPTTPPMNCAFAGLIDPVAEYDHSEGISIIGGHVYRGAAQKPLRGRYVFGDFSRTFNPADGRLFYINTAGKLADIFEFRLGREDRKLGMYVKGFGRDEAGELYLCASTVLGPTGTGGQVFRIVSVCYPDCNGDGMLNVADFGCFQTHFALGNSEADCNRDGQLNIADFGCFQTRFTLECR